MKVGEENVGSLHSISSVNAGSSVSVRDVGEGIFQ